MPSYYYSELTTTSQQIILTEEEFHHLAHVLRSKIGDVVKLNNGKGLIATGEISKIEKKQAIIQISDIVSFSQPQPCFALAFSLLKNKNDQWLVEKATELGVTDLFPITTRYSVRNPSENTLSRFRQTALAAIKQCDNPFLPAIHSILNIGTALQEIRNAGYQFIIASEHRPDYRISDLPQDTAFCFVIGPEGGFSPEEFILFAQENAAGVSLSPLVLKAETAAITAAAQFNLRTK